MKLKIKLLFIFLIAIAQINCSSESPSPEETIVVEQDNLQKKLHFSGTIEPLKERNISSPVDGTVEQMHFHYGQFVKKGQAIMTINSPTLQKQFNETLTEYLKSKDNYNVARAKFSGTQELWDAGLLAKNNYLSEKSNLNK